MSARSNTERTARVEPVDLPSLIETFAPYLRIAHQIPGRIRLKVDLAVLDDPAIRAIGTDSLSDALGIIPGVRNITVNKLARSCTVEYDKAHIPDVAWSDLLDGRQTPAAAILLGIIEDKFTEVRRGQP